jgi:hypothetical protein
MKGRETHICATFRGRSDPSLRHYASSAARHSECCWAIWVVMTTDDIAVLVVAAVAGGMLSAKYGARFWEKVRYLRWFVP